MYIYSRFLYTCYTATEKHMHNTVYCIVLLHTVYCMQQHNTVCSSTIQYTVCSSTIQYTVCSSTYNTAYTVCRCSRIIHAVILYNYYVNTRTRQLIFLRKSDCFGCAVLLCLVVCLTLLASFFLPSSSLI